ncbi:hypothetical protein Hanom_Chr11g01007371 [Helianthus anomalus]
MTTPMSSPLGEESILDRSDDAGDNQKGSPSSPRPENIESVEGEEKSPGFNAARNEELVSSSPAISSPLAYAPVGGPVEAGNLGEFYVEDEGLCMGEGVLREKGSVHSLSSNGGSIGAPNEVCFNWQAFMDSCVGSFPNASGNDKKGIHFFKASKKSKRFRKGGPKCHLMGHGASLSCGSDSSEKCRPKKRNRGP